MPQVVIHAPASISSEVREELVDVIRASIPKFLDVPEQIGQVLFYETADENRSAHPSRDGRFVFVETTMYPGRSSEMKMGFLRNLSLLIHRYTGVGSRDIICVIHEIPPDNYYGGVSHTHIDRLKESASGD